MTSINPQTSQTTKPNPALGNLDILIGEWDIVVSLPLDPAAEIRGRASFEWIENRTFLLYKSRIERAEFPQTVSIIGPDDAARTYSMLYFDSRGVSRIYEMSLEDGVWKLWRKFPGFFQRFAGSFSNDLNTITGGWEKSSDGSNWEHDFGLAYQRVR